VDDRFRPIYRSIYDARTTRQGVVGIRAAYGGAADAGVGDARLIGQAIEQAELQDGARTRVLREDAKALLAVNFEDLVLYPLRRGAPISTRETLDVNVRSDIRMLVERGARRAPRRAGGRPEISAREIIDALSESWSELRVGQHAVWE